MSLSHGNTKYNNSYAFCAYSKNINSKHNGQFLFRVSTHIHFNQTPRVFGGKIHYRTTGAKAVGARVGSHGAFRPLTIPSFG